MTENVFLNIKNKSKTITAEVEVPDGVEAKGGTGILFVNDKKVAVGRIDHTQPMFFFADETADVGIDLATPVVESIGAEKRLRFTGSIPKVTVEVK